MAAHLAASAIYALPARYEPFGLSALEAGLCGCALVLGDIPSLREVWGDAAVFVDPHDAQALAKALNCLIDHPEQRFEFGRARPGARAALFAARDGARNIWRRIAPAWCNRERRRSREDRSLLPFAGVRLEPRQRALPAGSGQRIDRARPRGRSCTNPRMRGACRIWSRNTVRRRIAGVSRRVPRPSIGPLRSATRWTSTARWTAPDLAIVHEWNDHELVQRVGEHRACAAGSYRLFFHDTHHRAVTAPEEMRGYDLSNYDGVLAYGNVLREIYTARGWSPRLDVARGRRHPRLPPAAARRHGG